LVLTCVSSATCVASVVTCVTVSLALTCVTPLSVMLVPSSSESQGLGKYGGDSGVTSESWVWMESVEDDGSRSGVPVDAQYVVSLVLRQSYGPWAHDECSSNTERCGGQFSVMQPDGMVLQFNVVLEQVWMSDERWFLTHDKKFLIPVVTDHNSRFLSFF